MQYPFKKLAKGLSYIGIVFLAPFIVIIFLVVAILYIAIALSWVAFSEVSIYLSKKLSTKGSTL